MSTAYIVDAVRTPIGRHKGALASVRPDQLASVPLKALIERSKIDPRLIEDVVMGCVTQVGEQGLNIGRIAPLVAGLPVDLTGTSVNRMCGSSLQAVNFAAMGVASGFQDVVIAGGVESMSRVPMGSDMMLNGEPALPAPELSWRFSIVPQGTSAELVARRFDLRREALDAFAYGSHQKAAAAQDAGWFDAEIAPVPTANGLVSRDEGIRRDTSLEKLGRLRPAFQSDGVITAGSSSQISDGAAAVLLASEAAVQRYGLRPRAKILAMATAGVDPTIMLTGPIPATRKVLTKAGLGVGDIDAFEINEAFASVVLATEQALELDPARVNPCGGAIALGHPLGASGARLVATLLSHLEKTGGRLGIATMCIGFGQGITTLIERL